MIFVNILNWLLLFGSGYLAYKNDRWDLFWFKISQSLQGVARLSLDPADKLIIFAFLLITINLIINIIFLIKKKRKLNKRQNKSLLNLIASILTFVFLVAIYFLNSNYTHCYHFFQLCKNGWHYEYNRFGQRVDVHYKTDLQGKKLPHSFIGCGYNGSPEDYHKLIMALPGIKMIEDNENQRVYQFLNGTKGYLNKKNKPYADHNLNIAIQNKDLVYSGTSCASHQSPIPPLE